MELIFTKTTSKSEAEKINEFWKFIESQDDIKPYQVEKKADGEFLKNYIFLKNFLTLFLKCFLSFSICIFKKNISIFGIE